MVILTNCLNENLKFNTNKITFNTNLKSVLNSKCNSNDGVKIFEYRIPTENLITIGLFKYLTFTLQRCIKFCVNSQTQLTLGMHDIPILHDIPLLDF